MKSLRAMCIIVFFIHFCSPFLLCTILSKSYIMGEERVDVCVNFCDPYNFFFVIISIVHSISHLVGLLFPYIVPPSCRYVSTSNRQKP